MADTIIRDFKDLQVWQVARCRQARGSLYELPDHLTTCADQGYLSVAEAQRLEALALRATQLLNGYLRSTLDLKRRAAS